MCSVFEYVNRHFSVGNNTVDCTYSNSEHFLITLDENNNIGNNHGKNPKNVLLRIEKK